MIFHITSVTNDFLFWPTIVLSLLARIVFTVTELIVGIPWIQKAIVSRMATQYVNIAVTIFLSFCIRPSFWLREMVELSRALGLFRVLVNIVR